MAGPGQFRVYQAMLSVVVVSILWGSAPLGAAEDGFRIELGHRGQYLDGEGTGHGDDRWYYYDQKGWWSQWFYNAPYDPNRKKDIETYLSVSLRDRKLPGRVEIACNWTTGPWSQLGKGAPPLPGDVADPARQSKYIAILPFVRMELPAGQIPQSPLAHRLTIPWYNPEWVSIDVRGENVVVEGWIKHECLPKGSETQACCLRSGACVDLPPEDCERVPVELLDPVTGAGTGIFVRVPGQPQGANTDCSTVDCPASATEIDRLELTGRVELITPQGAETVEVSGPAELHVFFEAMDEGAAADDDGNGLEEVATELLEMNLVGSSSLLGPVRVRLRSDVPSLGMIEEQANVTPGMLDLLPFAEGTADSFFDVFFEVEVDGPHRVLHALRPKHLAGVITHKPPAPYDNYSGSRPVELVDANGAATGYILGRVQLGQQSQACCLPDGTCADLPAARCRELGGTAQGPGTNCVTATCAGPTDCDWDPTRPHKMHWPQRPDLSPAGVDVDATRAVLADDFKCTATGPIAQIHLWASFAEDLLPSDGPGGLTLALTIFSDIPAAENSWSQPGEPLWTRVFSPGQYTVRRVHDGPEGWLDPLTDTYEPANHRQAYLYSFCIDEDDAYVQKEGTVYWLGLAVRGPANTVHRFGWKSTSPELHWNDDAVYQVAGAPWLPMTYPKGHEYAGRTLDLAFVIAGGRLVAPAYDLGDAPDSTNSYPATSMLAYPSGVIARYPTVYQAGSPPYGPIHWDPRVAVYLGKCVSLETEADLGPDEDPGNNLRPPADAADRDSCDDGVLLPLVLPHLGKTTFQYVVTVQPAAPALSSRYWVNVWIDWNRDGDWDDQLGGGVESADEWAVKDQTLALAPGTHVVATPEFLCWHPPGRETEPLWMRITISEQHISLLSAVTDGGFGSGPEAGYQYGETEDYLVYPQEMPGEPAHDWSDAPDGQDAPGYPTLALHGGASHVIAGPWLGDRTDRPDPEPDGRPDPLATGDDNTGDDDEDGVSVPPLMRGQPADITLDVGGGGGVLEAWIDYNADRIWQAHEQIFAGFLADGSHTISPVTPPDAAIGETFARFRISRGGGLGPGGAAPDGEVEDHQVFIGGGDCGGPMRPATRTDGQFIRGDANDDGVIDMSDAILILTWLFLGTDAPACADAADADDDGVVNINDALHVLRFRFSGGPAPAPPFPDCGPDPTPDSLSCGAYDSCPGDAEPAVPLDAKWRQLPDVTPRGVDIRVDNATLADDFACRSRARIVGVRLWGSWKDDRVGRINSIRLSIHGDDPAGVDGPSTSNSFSQPAPELLWERNFVPGEFEQSLYYTVRDPGEWWWDPVNGEIIEGGDTQIWAVDIDIDPNEAFLQEGSPDRPIIYWLKVRVETDGGAFGWKTRRWPDHFMDDAVWEGAAAGLSAWQELRYPPGHPYHEREKNSVDMAFCLTEAETVSYQPTFRPASVTRCPAVETRCPAVVTRCPPVNTRCPSVQTQCPPVETRCPPVQTRCPPVETECPPIQTKCPPVETECPPIETKCPPVETECPPIATKCPPLATECPPVQTRCPPVETECPPIETKCPPVETECPPIETKCPPVETECPPIETKCPPVETECPPIETKCPPVETECPPIETKCPPVATECPPVPTECPAVLTRCPPTPTECTVVRTQCPPVATECPPVETKCPPVSTECPAVLTRCPPTPTECAVVQTQCPPVETECPPVQTTCPLVLTSCPSRKTLCPTAATSCPGVPTRCPAVDTRCPPCVVMTPVCAERACPAVDVISPFVVASAANGPAGRAQRLAR